MTTINISFCKRFKLLYIAEWTQEYHKQYPDSTKLQAEVDEFMAKFDEKKDQVRNILINVI